jgi:hypothetical protein
MARGLGHEIEVGYHILGHAHLQQHPYRLKYWCLPVFWLAALS